MGIVLPDGNHMKTFLGNGGKVIFDSLIFSIQHDDIHPGIESFKHVACHFKITQVCADQQATGISCCHFAKVFFPVEVKSKFRAEAGKGSCFIEQYLAENEIIPVNKKNGFEEAEF